MYLAAQRVVSASAPESGVNVYKYVHWVQWQGPVPNEFLPDSNPGELVAQYVTVVPPGNDVLSYLDVVVHDGTPGAAVRELLWSLVFRIPPQPLPVVQRVDEAWVRFNMSPFGVDPRDELLMLASHIVQRLYPDL